jgi:hypothetical protein
VRLQRGGGGGGGSDGDRVGCGVGCGVGLYDPSSVVGLDVTGADVVVGSGVGGGGCI